MMMMMQSTRNRMASSCYLQQLARRVAAPGGGAMIASTTTTTTTATRSWSSSLRMMHPSSSSSLGAAIFEQKQNLYPQQRASFGTTTSNNNNNKKKKNNQSLADQIAQMSTAASDDNNNNNNSHSSTRTRSSPIPIVDVRKQLWDFYLSTGRGANALFEAIDLDENGKIEPADLKTFMLDVLRSSAADDDDDDGIVDPRDIMPYAWNRLEQREAAGQAYDQRAFKKWLVAATKMSADMKNSRMLEILSRQEPDAYWSEVEDNNNTSNNNNSHEQQQARTYTWNEETMSQSLRRMQYAVRGEVVMRADQLAAQGKDILYTNIGNPHQVQQQPITYYRQVLALCDLPAAQGVDHPKVYEMFPRDVVERAKEYRAIIGPSGTGAYTHSQGILGLRKHIAEFIQNRDGYRAYPGNIFLTNGASAAIGMVLQGLLANYNDAVMIPIPQVCSSLVVIDAHIVVPRSLYTHTHTHNSPIVSPSVSNLLGLDCQAGWTTSRL